MSAGKGGLPISKINLLYYFDYPSPEVGLIHCATQFEYLVHRTCPHEDCGTGGVGTPLIPQRHLRTADPDDIGVLVRSL